MKRSYALTTLVFLFLMCLTVLSDKISGNGLEWSAQTLVSGISPEEYTPLVNFVGNWSNLELAEIKGMNFTEVILNIESLMFDSPTFTLIGNGKLYFDLNAHGYHVELPRNKSLLFHWKDYGEIPYANYVGVSFSLKLDNGENKTVYIAKHTSETFLNTSTALLLFANPGLETGKYWEKWGVEVATLMDFFETETLTLNWVRYLHQCQISGFGPRTVEYTQPLLVDSLEREKNNQGAFLGILDENSTTIKPNPSSTITPNTSFETTITAGFVPILTIIVVVLGNFYWKKRSRRN